MKLFSLLAFLIFITPALAQPLFSDSFESGDLGAGHDVGFSWESPNRTSLVKRDPQLGDMIVYNRGGPIELLQGTDKEWTAKEGQISLRFDYPAGKGGWSEQRFGFDTARPDLWIRYWLKVPKNFKHTARNPSNNKLFALWMDGYSSKGAGPTVIWEFWHDGSGGSRLAYHYSPGGHRTAGTHRQEKAFITYPDDQGRWMQIVMHVKAASAASANDGIIQLYRRWENENSFTLLHDDKGANIAAPANASAGWRAGYFMGWSNAGYAAPTEWFLDGLVISSTNLLTIEPMSTSASGSKTTSNALFPGPAIVKPKD
jgi:hypothetical protein